MECFRALFDHLEWIEHLFLSGIRDLRKSESVWGMMRGVVRIRKSIHRRWLAKGLGLGLRCWRFKGVQDEIPRDEANTLQIGSMAFPPGQCTSLQLHPCHRLFEQGRHQFLCLPIDHKLLPVTFGYSLSSWVFVMRQLMRRKRLWRRSLTRSHKRTSISCWNGTTSALQPEEITLKWTRVSCVYYQWKWPYEKSLETYLMIHVNSERSEKMKHRRFGLVSLFYGRSTFVGYLIPKPSF